MGVGVERVRGVKRGGGVEVEILYGLFMVFIVFLLLFMFRYEVDPSLQNVPVRSQNEGKIYCKARLKQ